MFEKTVLSGEVVEAPYFGVTNSGTDYARVKVRINRPQRRRGNITFFTVFCYALSQVTEVQERALPGVPIFCVGELRADWNTGSPQIRTRADGKTVATYDLTAKMLSFPDSDVPDPEYWQLDFVPQAL